MEVLSLILLIAVSAQSSLASRLTQLQAPPDIVILKWSWNEYSTLPQNTETNPRSRDPFGPKDHLEEARQRVMVDVPANKNRPLKRYQYKVVVKNTGTKTIKSLIWNYIFMEPGKGDRFEVHEFRTEKTIKPGQKQQLTQLSLTPPSRVVHVDALNKTEGNPSGERVIITRIKYADGSVWNLESN